MNRTDGIFYYVTIHKRTCSTTDQTAGHGIDLSIEKGLVLQDEGFALRRFMFEIAEEVRQTRQGSAAKGRGADEVA
jgi:hypothetical protein